MMLHNEARELVAEAYEKTHDAKRLSEDFGICERTVYKLVAQKRKTGTVELRLHTRGRKKKLVSEDLAAIRKLIDEQNDITINEIRDTLHLSASYSTVERAVRAMGFRFKKKTLHASECDRHRYRGKAQGLGGMLQKH